MSELGGVPMIIRSTEMSNTIPDQKVTATFLVRMTRRSVFIGLVSDPILPEVPA